MPAYHQGFILKKLESLPSDNYPGANYVRSAFAGLTSKIAFDNGLTILLDGLQGWLATPQKPKRPSKPRAAAKKSTSPRRGQGKI